MSLYAINERMQQIQEEKYDAIDAQSDAALAKLNAEEAALKKRTDEIMKSDAEMQRGQSVMPNATPAQRFVTNVVLKALKNIRGITVHHATKADVVRILARMNKGVEMMGNRIEKRKSEIADYFKDKDLTPTQRSIVDVFGGKQNSTTITFTDEIGKERTLHIRRGNDYGGAQHAVLRHYNDRQSNFNAEDVAKINTILEKGQRKNNGNGKFEYIYTDENGVRYTLATAIDNRQEVFVTFYTNKEASSTGLSNTQLSAQAQENTSNSAAKVTNKIETTKSKSEIELLTTSDGTIYGWSVGNEIWLTDDGMNPETPIHEYIHLFVKAMSQEDSKEWRHVVELCKKNKVLWDEVANDPNYAHLQEIKNEEERDSAIASELLARYGGKRGSKQLEEKAAQMEQEGHSFESDVTAKLMVSRMKKAIEAVYQWALDKLGIPHHYKSIDEVVDKGLYNLLSESDINTAAQSIARLNERFNQDLDRYIQNETPKGFRFELGMPSAYLTSAGFPNLPITLRSALLARKAGDTRHPFEADDIRDLVKAIQKPIAIFTYSKDNMRNLIVDTMHNGKHFLVGITLGYKSGELEVNSVSGLFPKESHEWVKWIQDGKAVRIDQKEKVQDLINSLRTNPAESERIGLNLDSAAKIVQNFDNPKLPEENDVRLSIIGERGAANLDHAEEVTARMDNLQVARDMEQDGKDARTIRLATGWERGADHKWRYEIPDAIYSDKWEEKNRVALRNMSPADKRVMSKALRYYQKSNYKTFLPAHQQRYDEILNRYGYVDEESLTLKDVLVGRGADNLFAAYPELKNVSFCFESMDPDADGYSNRKENKIRLSKKIRFDNKKINSVLSHEIQHLIQDIEGFAKGGSTESIKDLIISVANERNARYWADELRKEREKIGKRKNPLAVEEALEKEWIDEYQKQGLDYEEWMPDEKTRKKGFDYFVRGYADSSLDEAVKQFKFDENTIFDDIYAFEKYHSLAGEVEARNVQKRLRLDEQRRRELLLAKTEDVAREDQIFLLGENIVGSDVRFSISDAEPYDYETYPYGRVEPNLEEKEVEIVDTNANHGFANYNDARNWAKQNISKTYSNEQTGGKGDIRISNAAIDKFLSQSSVDKSDNKDVHLSVLKVLPDLLRTSIDVETHPDFLKGTDGKRTVGNEINKNVLVHRCYGAVSIDGVPYRVKITLKEDVRNSNLPHNTHSYEATKIELLAGTLVKPNGDNPNTNNSISAAKLLQNVGMSYNPSEKVLEKSRERTKELHTLTDQARREMRAIMNRAKADGTYMKAPNGNPTNLTPKQWAQTRTEAFKAWFGDWELAAKAKTIQALQSVKTIPHSMARTELETVYKNLPAVTKGNITISFYRSAFDKNYRENGLFAAAVPVLDRVLNNAILAYREIDNRAGELRKDGTTHKQHRNIESYDNYVGKVQINGNKYYVRFTVTNEKSEHGVHSQFVSNVELYNNSTKNASGRDSSLPSRLVLDGITDAKLLHFFESAKEAQENSSKCMDENGEPKIVYRGSKNANSYVFHTRYDNAGYWFTDNRSIAEHYARRGADHELSQEELDERVQPCFLNVRSSENVDAGGRTWQNVYEQPKYAIYDDKTGRMTEFDTREEAEQYCKENGLDPDIEIDENNGISGDIAENRIINGADGMLFQNMIDGNAQDGTNIPSNIWVVKDNTQAKSAEENSGEFDSANPDIRFQIGKTKEEIETQIESGDISKVDFPSTLDSIVSIECPQYLFVSVFAAHLRWQTAVHCVAVW